MQVPQFNLNYEQYTFNKPKSEQIKMIHEWRIQLLTKMIFYRDYEIERLKEKKKRMQQRLAQLPELIAEQAKERDYFRNRFLELQQEKIESYNKYQKLKSDYLTQAPLDKRDLILNQLDKYEKNVNHYVKLQERVDATRALKEHNARPKIIKQSYDPIMDENQIKADIRKRIEEGQRLQEEMLAPSVEKAIRRYLQK